MRIFFLLWFGDRIRIEEIAANFKMSKNSWRTQYMSEVVGFDLWREIFCTIIRLYGPGLKAASEKGESHHQRGQWKNRFLLALQSNLSILLQINFTRDFLLISLLKVLKIRYYCVVVDVLPKQRLWTLSGDTSSRIDVGGHFESGSIRPIRFCSRVTTDKDASGNPFNRSCFEYDSIIVFTEQLI